MLVIVACGEDSLPYLNEGNDLYSNGYYQEAIKQYDEAIRLNPQFGEAYSNRGVAYDRIGKSIEAERDYAKAKELGYVAP